MSYSNTGTRIRTEITHSSSVIAGYKPGALPLSYTSILSYPIKNSETYKVWNKKYKWERIAQSFMLISVTLSGNRDSRNRTHVNGFGDHCFTIKLYPYHLALNERLSMKLILITPTNITVNKFSRYIRKSLNHVGNYLCKVTGVEPI